MTAEEKEEKLLDDMKKAPVKMKKGEHFCCNWELARWLQQGKGLVCFGTPSPGAHISVGIQFELYTYYDSPDLGIYIKKYGDTRWHEPTREYMGLAIGKKHNKVVEE